MYLFIYIFAGDMVHRSCVAKVDTMLVQNYVGNVELTYAFTNTRPIAREFRRLLIYIKDDVTVLF